MRRIILILGLLTVIGFCIYPPYRLQRTKHLIHHADGLAHLDSVTTERIGHWWVWRPPAGWETTEYSGGRIFTTYHAPFVDWTRLGKRVGWTFIATLGGFAIFRKKGR